MSVPSESLCSQYRGSLRAGSYNRAALRTAIELKPPAMTIETADILAFRSTTKMWAPRAFHHRSRP